MADIQHLIKGNQNRVGEARVDKIETDRFNSIVERISGVNPSKLAAEVTGKGKSEAESFDHLQPSQAAQQMMEAVPQTTPSGVKSASPAQQLAANRPDAQVQYLMGKVAMLEQRLAQHEVFNANDNDVVSTTTTPAAKLNRGADSSAYGSGTVRKKNAKSKDPVDGKPDGQADKEAKMAGERVNILGVTMNEWRSMAGLQAPPVDLTSRPAEIEESVDEIEVNIPPEQAAKFVDKVKSQYNENQLWVEFLATYESTPEEFAAFVEAADEAGDEEAILAIQDLEDEFIESLSENESGAALAHSAQLKLRQLQAAEKVRTKIAAAKKNTPTVVKKAMGLEGNMESEDLSELWAQWLAERDLSVEMFDALVEAAETDEDLETLEVLQSMFEAEIVGKRIAGSSPTPSGEGELREPGKAPVKTVSLARGEIKPARKNVPSLPKFMRKKLGMPVDDSKNESDMDEDDDTFECDCDDKGDPDMKHPGWAKAMKRFKMSHKKSGRKS